MSSTQSSCPGCNSYYTWVIDMSRAIPGGKENTYNSVTRYECLNCSNVFDVAFSLIVEGITGHTQIQNYLIENQHNI